MYKKNNVTKILFKYYNCVNPIDLWEIYNKIYIYQRGFLKDEGN